MAFGSRVNCVAAVEGWAGGDALLLGLQDGRVLAYRGGQADVAYAGAPGAEVTALPPRCRADGPLALGLGSLQRPEEDAQVLLTQLRSVAGRLQVDV